MNKKYLILGLVLISLFSGCLEREAPRGQVITTTLTTTTVINHDVRCANSYPVCNGYCTIPNYWCTRVGANCGCVPITATTFPTTSTLLTTTIPTTLTTSTVSTTTTVGPISTTSIPFGTPCNYINSQRSCHLGGCTNPRNICVVNRLYGYPGQTPCICSSLTTTSTVGTTTTSTISTTSTVPTTTTTLHCTDTDDWSYPTKDYYEKGMVSDGFHSDFWDYCLGDTILYEYYCPSVNSYYTFEVNHCNYGCSGGKCNEATTTSLPANYCATVCAGYDHWAGEDNINIDECEDVAVNYCYPDSANVHQTEHCCCWDCAYATTSTVYTTTTTSPWFNDCHMECDNSGRGYKYCGSWGGDCKVNEGILLPAGDYGCEPAGFVCCCAWKDVWDACHSYDFRTGYCVNTLHELYNPATSCEGGSGTWLDTLNPQGNQECSANFRACCYD